MSPELQRALTTAADQGGADAGHLRIDLRSRPGNLGAGMNAGDHPRPAPPWGQPMRLLCWWRGCGWTLTTERWTGKVLNSTPCLRCGRDYRGRRVARIRPTV